jgi:hypothetical protein
VTSNIRYISNHPSEYHPILLSKDVHQGVQNDGIIDAPGAPAGIPLRECFLYKQKRQEEVHLPRRPEIKPM